MFGFSSDIKDTLRSTTQYERYLMGVLEKKGKRRDYFNRIKSDTLRGIYDKNFDEITDEQEYCKSSYVDINNSIQNLIKCKKLIGKINNVLLDSKKILNTKKMGNLKGVVRTSILDNREHFEDLISPNNKDTPEEIAYKERIQDTLRLIGEEDVGDDDDENEFGVGPSISNEDSWNDEEDDPLYGTRGWVSRGPPDAHGIKKTRSKKNQTKKRKTIKRSKKSKYKKIIKSGKTKKGIR
jgi:hypothetical protein